MLSHPAGRALAPWERSSVGLGQRDMEIPGAQHLPHPALHLLPPLQLLQQPWGGLDTALFFLLSLKLLLFLGS